MNERAQWLDLIWYQAAFWALIGTAGTPLEAPVCALLLASMLLIWRAVPRLRPAPLLFAATAALGPLVDAALAGNDWIIYESALGWAVPLWVFTLWVVFAQSAQQSLSRALQMRSLWVWPLLLLGPPAAYAAGTRLGAASFAQPVATSLIAIGLAWLPVMAGLRAALTFATQSKADWPSDSLARKLP